ncbi:MAG: YHYH protein [Planctomycetaceae bacterium]
MNWHFYVSSVIALLLIYAGQATAHPGGHGHESNDPKASRTWTLAAEGSHLHGTFVSAKDGKVQIRRDDGVVVTFVIDRFVTSDREWIAQRVAAIKKVNEQPNLEFVHQKTPATLVTQRLVVKKAPAMFSHFQPFEKSLELRWDERFLYVGSNGLPNHPMMVGITAWQQQVPLPQKYFGENAWRIPLHPIPAKEPAMIKGHFLRGAIALGVNGIPIFNPQNNRGEVSAEIGELDEYGGHCGRADDYHYHLAPVHLEKIVGKDKPIAYALDGYPIYGFQDEKAPDFAPLDRLSGHKDKEGNYHYHATKQYPYVIGGFFGEVIEREGQVDPQPRAEGVRPALTPLRDAKIVGFDEVKAGSYRLTYDVRGKQGTVSYTIGKDGTAQFVFVDPNGKTVNETYSPRQRGPGGKDRPPRPSDNPPPREDRRPSPSGGSQSQPRNEPRKPNQPTGGQTSSKESKIPPLKVSSPSVDDQGHLLLACTCDGDGQSPAIAWSDAPAGTKSFAISLWHTAPDQEKSYWVVYNIPATVKQLPQNCKNIGTLGLNGKRRREYDPMCSKGPGLKTYHITVYALSEELNLDPAVTDRRNLMKAVEKITLAEGTFDYLYERRSVEK